MSTGYPEDNNQNKRSQPTVATTRVNEAIGCVALIACFFVCVFGMVSCVEIDKTNTLQRVINRNKPFVDANDGQVKVLWVYPRHGHKGAFSGHYAVVEGVKTKERIEIHVQPHLPVPGEVWQIELNKQGHYIFINKLK